MHGIEARKLALPGPGERWLAVGCGLLEVASNVWAPLLDGCSGVFVASDAAVFDTFAQLAAKRLGARKAVKLQAGYRARSWHSLKRVCEALADSNANRDTLLIAIGGSAAISATGFAAAVYMGGIRWVAVPTTLSAMLSTALGSWSGLDVGNQRELVGSRWPPTAVIADVSTLVTLPDRVLRAGLVHAVRCGWALDRKLLSLLPGIRPATYSSLTEDKWALLVEEVVRSILPAAGKAQRKSALMLGQAFAAPLEKAAGKGYLLRGEALAWGIKAAAALSSAKGLISHQAKGTLMAVLSAVEPTPPLPAVPAAELIGSLRQDQALPWVVPTDTGTQVLQHVKASELLAAFKAIGLT